MPEQPGRFDPRQTERLDQAIDRIVSGAPPQPSGDPELDPLVTLAARLHRDLPRDLPDPAFRARLKDDLTGRIPVVQPVPRRPVYLRQLPVYASIAAVFAIALVVGALAFWPDENDAPEQASGTTLMQATTAVSETPEAATETVSSDVAARPAEPTMASTVALVAPNPTTAQEAADTPAATSEPTAVPSPTAPSETSTPAAPGSATVLQANLPAVDSATIEQGPVPAAGGGGEGPSDDVTYVMAVAAPTIATSSTVYHLTPPSSDPVEFCSELAAKAGIPAEDVRTTDASGYTEVFAGDGEAGVVYWRPEAGVFQISSASAGGADVIDAAGVADHSLAWLEAIGYPVESLGTPRVDDLGDLWLVDIPLDGVPAPAVGHPLGVMLLLHRDGSLAEARGYWLGLDGEDAVPIVDIAQAWDDVTHGGGYWRDGGMSAGGGEFRAESVRLSNVLTRAGDDLVLQPVIEFAGTFTSSSGDSSAPVSVFVKAAAD